LLKYIVIACLFYINPPELCQQAQQQAISLKAANIVAGRYAYLQDLLEIDRCRDSATTPPVQWPVCPSPIHLENWEDFLNAHPDQQYAAYIRSGLASGFRIGFNRSAATLKSYPTNHPSAMANARVVSDHIAAELQAGRLVGPLAPILCPLVKTSPLGLVPKSHQVDKWRVIVDLSFPRGASVNAGIDEDLASITYAKVDDAVQQILKLGKGAQLAKLDLKNAYRFVPIHPQDQHLLGISWEGKTYVDRALPFGLRSAPKIFSAVADMLAWALHWAGVPHLIHYLDDFLLLAAPSTEEGARVLALALHVFAMLGVPVSAHKTEGPATCVTFLGILIDTKAFELRLPMEKVKRLRDLLVSWITRKSCTRKELESLLGHLSHAAVVIRPGRTFLRQLFGLLHHAKAPHHFIRLTAGARADLAWWRCYLQSWNGSSFFPLPDPSWHVFSDASGSWGYGALTEGLGWLQSEWPQEWKNFNIAAKEMIPMVLAAALWGRYWAGKHICFHSDNVAVVAILQSRTAKTQLLMHLLRCFAFFSAYFRFHYSAQHVPGTMNMVADALSRNHVPLSVSQMPQFHVPTPLHNLLIAVRPDWGSPTWTQLFSSSLDAVLLSPH